MLLALVALLICLVSTRRLRRLARRMPAALTATESDLRLHGLTVSNVFERVARLERDLRTLRETQSQIETRAVGPSNYGQAINLVQRGWRIEDLVRSCGLTRGEAELVYLLHGPGGGLNSKRNDRELNN